MAKEVIIESLPDLKKASQRRRNRTEFIKEEMVIPSRLKMFAEGKKFFIRTYGCQANVLDSQNIEGILLEIGYTPVDDPLDADIVILNTCAIRENAEDKVFGEIGSLKQLKNKKPDSLICICGCMTQQPHIVETLKKTYRQVDIIFGTHNINHLPQLILRSVEKQSRVIEVYSKEGEVIENIPCHREDRIKAFVNIMYGCDKFCTYCIVPYTRGKQRSRKMEDILHECEQLVKDGYQEITLIGQNVNAYAKDLDCDYDFATLLVEVAKLGIPRLRFTTSHPWDFTEKMFEAMGTYKNIMPAIHLPLQSGSDDVLRRMGRRYTSKEYMHLVNRLREIVPNVAITTDIIVGFPNETDEDFEKTLDVVRYVKYDSAFTFIYSKRSGTPAAEMDEQIPEDVVKDRFNRLLEVVQKCANEQTVRFEGEVQSALVEELNSQLEGFVTGRLSSGLLVHFPGTEELIGKIVDVKLNEAKGFYYMGEMTN